MAMCENKAFRDQNLDRLRSDSDLLEISEVYYKTKMLFLLFNKVKKI